MNDKKTVEIAPSLMNWMGLFLGIAVQQTR